MRTGKHLFAVLLHFMRVQHHQQHHEDKQNGNPPTSSNPDVSQHLWFIKICFPYWKWDWNFFVYNSDKFNWKMRLNFNLSEMTKHMLTVYYSSRKRWKSERTKKHAYIAAFFVFFFKAFLKNDSAMWKGFFCAGSRPAW